MNDQNKNLILAIVLTFAVVMVWTALFPPEEIPVDPTDPVLQTSEGSALPQPDAPTATGTTAPSEPVEAAAEAPRVAIQSDTLSGSISLLGGRIDDLALTDYRETLDEDAETVRLMRPVGENDAYIALFGWTGDVGVTPNDTTVWTLAEGDTLTPDTPVTLEWDNGQGQLFQTTISMDDEFMFSFDQTLINQASDAIASRPYGLIRRYSEPDELKNFFILHEGLVRMTDGELIETDYDDVVDFGADSDEAREEASEGGWIGWTDHYWMTTLIPDQSQPFRTMVRHVANRDIYQAEAVMPSQNVAAGASTTVTTRFFAGAKEWEAIKNYDDNENVGGFLDSIDWGWFFFLTKPIFWVLHTLNALIGNMGWAIIALTIFLKALVLPLAYKSYVSMAKMKELQPEMEKLKENAGDDRQAMQQGMMKLYKDNKVNPAAGCLPILLQIPIFFSLYKAVSYTHLTLPTTPYV